jgi:hypothetical protein
MKDYRKPKREFWTDRERRHQRQQALVGTLAVASVLVGLWLLYLLIA